VSPQNDFSSLINISNWNWLGSENLHEGRYNIEGVS
jgi:hypothetical protein